MKKQGHRSHVSGVRRFLSGKKASPIQDKLVADAKRIAKKLRRRKAPTSTPEKGT